MLIRNITIENFQSYYGIQTLEFSKGLNLVIGKNGKGKSKLFNAFYWVLFGKIYGSGIGWCSTNGLPYSAKNLMKRHEFINQKALYDLQVGNNVQTRVRIELENDKGLLFEIERSVIIQRLIDNGWEIDKNHDNAWNVSDYIIKVAHDSTTGTKFEEGDAAEDCINELFPEGIRNYIWFQGESLERLINFRDSKTLKAAVKHISYYPFYENLSNIITCSIPEIEKIETRKIKENNKYDSTIKGLISTIETRRGLIANEESNKIKIEEHIRTINIALTDDDTKMKGLASYSGLVSKYEQCKQEIQAVMSELTNIDNYQREQLPKLWLLRGISPMIEKCEGIIKNHTEEQDTAPEKKYLDDPSRAKLEGILRDGKCFVCGSNTSDGTDAHNWVLHRLKEQENYLREREEYENNIEFSKKFERFIGKIQDYPNLLLISLSAIDKQYKDSEEKIEKLMISRRKFEKQKKELDDQIEDAKRKYGVDPVKQAQNFGILDSTIKISRNSLEKKQRELTASIQTLTKYKAELKKAEEDLEKISGKQGGVKVEETEWKLISVFLGDICKRVQENARIDLLHNIEFQSNEFYKQFTQHDSGYKGTVKINDDYSIEFDANLNPGHEDRKKLSIINAMLSLNQKAMNTFYPFISDAPSSNFDIPTTHNYLLGVKDVFDQSIIMTKDVDVESEYYQNLKQQNKVSRIFSLESHLYCPEGQDPEKHEVSTDVIILKK
ncbi:chromosome segregation protein [Bacteroidales bacterium Barb6]|nr:chromosome segregation protein [Bacteroidales bacterium Barb6]